jgi:hypothetical protein
MTRASFSILALILILVATGCSSQSPSPPEILDKAIEAHGGRDNLVKPRLVFLKSVQKHDKGVVSVVEFIDYPEKYKRVGDGTHPNGVKGVQTLVCKNGVLYARNPDGTTMEQDADLGETLGNSLGYLISLVQIKDSARPLTLLPESKIQGEAAYGIEGTGANEKKVKIYFSKKTGLLVKITSFMELPGKSPVPVHVVFEDFREFDGAKVAHKWSGYLMDQKQPMDTMELTEVKTVDRFDVGVFDLP